MNTSHTVKSKVSVSKEMKLLLLAGTAWMALATTGCATTSGTTTRLDTAQHCEPSMSTRMTDAVAASDSTSLTPMPGRDLALCEPTQMKKQGAPQHLYKERRNSNWRFR